MQWTSGEQGSREPLNRTRRHHVDFFVGRPCRAGFWSLARSRSDGVNDHEQRHVRVWPELEQTTSEAARMSETPDRRLSPRAPPSEWPDLAGRLVSLDGAPVHVLPVRVYFEDTDFSGLVYHASYVRWCERGRSDFLRLLGSEHRALIDGAAGGEPAAFVVRRINLEYLKPARIDDVLEITTRVRSMTAATLVLSQSVSRDGQPLCEAEVTVVLVSASGRVLRLSAGLKARLATRIDGG
jgi:acyl-CoA thioester hydrolase